MSCLSKVLVRIIILSVVLSAASPVMAAQFSSADVDNLLHESWSAYREHFIRSDGRVVDPDGEKTTSEGQSYALLRAAFLDDRDTFGKVWSWTKQNLTRSDGQSFAWKWGTKCDG